MRITKRDRETRDIIYKTFNKEYEDIFKKDIFYDNKITRNYKLHAADLKKITKTKKEMQKLKIKKKRVLKFIYQLDIIINVYFEAMSILHKKNMINLKKKKTLHNKKYSIVYLRKQNPYII